MKAIIIVVLDSKSPHFLQKGTMFLNLGGPPQLLGPIEATLAIVIIMDTAIAQNEVAIGVSQSTFSPARLSPETIW